MPGDVDETKKNDQTTLKSTINLSSSASTDLEQLRIDDLQASSRQYTTPIHKAKPAQVPHDRESLTHCSFNNGCSTAVENAIASGNFTVYQGGDLNNFFGCDVFAPKRVSEVCLVNDHYILVKIPESQSTPQESTQIGMSYKTLQSSNLASENVRELESGKNFTRYFQCGNARSRRISPTPETVHPRQTAASIAWSANGCVQEVFKSRTIIKGNLNVFHPNSTSNLGKQEFENASTDIEKSTELTEPNNQESTLNASLQTPLETSLKDHVELEVHGRLEAPQGDFNETRKRPRKHILPRPRGAFSLSLSWLLKSLRVHHSAKKPPTKKKINAVIYKTFFVSWTKAGCPKCCGIKNTLRRTRSAVF